MKQSKQLLLLSFVFCLFSSFSTLAQPFNNSACNATLLSIDQNCNGYEYTNEFADDQVDEPDCSTGADQTVWFKFVAPPSGQVQVLVKENTIQVSRMGVFAVTDCSNFATFSELACEFSDIPPFDVIPGDTYYIQVSDLSGSGSFCIQVLDCPAPTNDNACDAIPLAIDQNCTDYQYNNDCATPQANEPSCATGDDQTVWFTFVAPPSGRVQILTKSNTLLTSRVGVYVATDCDNFGTFSQLDCDFTDIPPLDVVPNDTYYIQVSDLSGSGSFCIQVLDCPAPVNDDACNATPLVIDGDCNGYPYQNNCATAQANEPSCATGDDKTLWFTFVAPSSGRVQIITKANTIATSRIGVFMATDCDNFGTFSQLDCDFTDIPPLDVVPNDTYYTQVSDLSGSGSFCIQVLDCPKPANDDACNAIPLAIDGNCSGYPYQNNCATSQSNEPSCATGDDKTLWFTFVAPSSGRVQIITKANTIATSRIGVFTATDCDNFGTFSQLDCDFTDIPPFDVVPNDMYYIQVSDLSGSGSFCIQVLDCPVPVNDDACDAIPLAVNGNCNGYEFSNQCATPQANEPSCATGDDQTVWFSFVAPPSGFVDISTKVNTLQTSRIGVFAVTDCDNFGTFSQISCSFSSLSNVPVISGDTYYVQVSSLSGTGTFCIQVSEGTPPMSTDCLNDNACSAIPITLDAPCTFSSTTCGTAQVNEPSSLCFLNGATDLNSVWFSFTAPSSGRVLIKENGLLNSQFAVYQISNCANLVTAIEVFCTTNDIEFVSDLTPGDTYYVQVDGILDVTGEICLEIEACDPVPSNDLACNAIPIVLDEPCNFSLTNCASLEAGEVSASCFLNSGPTDLNTVWFTFTAPSSGRVSILENGLLNSQFAVYEVPDCANLSTAIQVFCTTNDIEFVADLTPGNTYYVQVDGVLDATGEICLEIEACEPVPSNDLACNAIPIVLNEPCNFSLTNCASLEAGEVSASCFLNSGPTDINTVWFTFTAPSSGRVSILENGILNSQFAVYEVPDCANLSTAIPIFCTTNEIEFVSDLTPGNTYYVQVDGVLDATGEICLEIEACEPVPSNDLACNAIPIVLNEPCNFSLTNCASLEAGEVSASCFLNSGPTDINTVWFTFTAPSSGRVSILENGILNSQFAVYEVPDCANLSTAIQVFCTANEIEFVSDLTPGNTYYVQVDGVLDATGEICLAIEACEQVPANDLACNATPIVLGEPCNFSLTDCASLEAGEASASCFFNSGPTDINTVWFTFIAPSSGLVEIDEAGLLSAQLAVYTILDCSDLTTATQVFCSRNQTNTLSSLVAGELYYVQVDGTFDNVGELCLEIVDPNNVCPEPLVRYLTTPESGTQIYQAKSDILSIQELSNTSNVEYKAGSSVELLPGFSAEGEFLISIEVCPN